MSSCDYVVAVIIVPQLYCMVDSQLLQLIFTLQIRLEKSEHVALSSDLDWL